VVRLSDARFPEMLDDNTPSQKYRDTAIPRYFAVDVKAVFLLYVFFEQCKLNF